MPTVSAATRIRPGEGKAPKRIETANIAAKIKAIHQASPSATPVASGRGPRMQNSSGGKVTRLIPDIASVMIRIAVMNSLPGWAGTTSRAILVNDNATAATAIATGRGAAVRLAVARVLGGSAAAVAARVRAAVRRTVARVFGAAAFTVAARVHATVRLAVA